MYIEEDYIINQKMMFMTALYDRNGKKCTRVGEENKQFFVDKSPLEILDKSIKWIGFDLKGAMSTSKWILGDIRMCPVMVNPIQKICVFPNRSPKHEDVIWFNPNHILRTSSMKQKTKIEFKNGFILMIPSRLTFFNTKLQSAEQLQRITVAIGKNPSFPNHLNNHS